MRNGSPNGDRPYSDIEQLLATLTALGDHGMLRRPVIWIDGEECRVTLTLNGNEYKGKGRDPWEAVKDMAEGAAKLSEAVLKHL